MSKEDVRAVAYVDGKLTMMHRLIMCATDRRHVDHINGNPLDNRRCNLRYATQGQNMQNTKARKGRRFKGTHFRRGAWHAQIKVAGVHKIVRVGGTEEDAARAYDALARQHFGEFARLNFPESYLTA